MHRYSLLIVTGGICLGLAWLLQGPASSADEKTPPAEKRADKEKPGLRKSVLKAFMHKKLSASQSLLEGLVTEDFNLIADGAKQLKTTALAAEFMVFDDAEYVEHADDYRRVVNKLAVAAKEKRLEGATLGYMDMTMQCVECHKRVRNAALPE